MIPVLLDLAGRPFSRRRRSATLLLVQLWLACAMPVLHARQESQEQRQGPLLGDGRSSAVTSHGAGCAVCTLVVTPALAAVAITASGLTDVFSQSGHLSQIDHPLYQPSRPLGARAPPQL